LYWSTGKKKASGSRCEHDGTSNSGCLLEQRASRSSSTRTSCPSASVRLVRVFPYLIRMRRGSRVLQTLDGALEEAGRCNRSSPSTRKWQIALARLFETYAAFDGVSATRIVILTTLRCAFIHNCQDCLWVLGIRWLW